MGIHDSLSDYNQQKGRVIGLDLLSDKASNKKKLGKGKDDEVTIAGVGSEGGYKSPMKLKWTSTHQMDGNGVSVQDTLRRIDGEEEGDMFENSMFGESSVNPARI